MSKSGLDAARKAAQQQNPIALGEPRGGSRSLTAQHSDVQAIEFVADMNLDKAVMTEMWTKRWTSNSDLRAEFPTAEIYSAFMNAEISRKKKAAPGTGASKEMPAPLDEQEAALVVSAQGLTDADRSRAFKEHWTATPSVRAEFDSAESYAAFLNAAARGRVRIFRGRTTG